MLADEYCFGRGNLPPEKGQTPYTSRRIMYVRAKDAGATLQVGGELIHENPKTDITYDYAIVKNPLEIVFGFDSM